MISELEYKVLKALENGLPLTGDPFGELARRAGVPEDLFYATVRELKRRGVVRRVSVVLRHHAAGIKGNIMAAFNVPAQLLTATGQRLARETYISHCYARKAAPHWPYNLYAMLHAETPEQARTLARALCRELKIDDFILLPTVKELKKSSFLLPAKME